MPQKDAIHIKIKEGGIKNYFDGLLKHLGGTVDGNAYHFDQGGNHIDLRGYSIYPDIELIVSETTNKNMFVLDRIPDGNPDLIHINIFKKGQFSQYFDGNEKIIEADTMKGIFLYDGLFPLKAIFPANALYKSIGFKVHRHAIEALLPESLPAIEAIFDNKGGMAYHISLPAEIDRLTDDLFHYRDVKFGSRSMIKARGLETFTSLMQSIQSLADNDELRGLHIEDYQRLIKLKDKMLSDFSQKISIDGLAIDFGISVSKLKRDFKTLFDCSVYQFFTHAKMDEAYRLLKTGDYSVMEVGYDLGYQNLSKFSEMFKKVKGISPKEVISLTT